jgi:two-component system, OmpR family, sensor kinase
MVKSIRVRLQIWYAAVLVAVIAGFAGVLYYQVRTSRLHQVDERLAAATRYLEATIRALPPHELDDRPPPLGRPFEERARNLPANGRRAAPLGPPDGPPRDGPPRGEGPVDLPPRDRPPLGQRPPADRLRAAIDLPDSLWDRPDDEPRDRPYFVIWRANDTVLASSSERVPAARPAAFELSIAQSPVFRWERDGRREAYLLGPRGAVILVGKALGRELGELRTLAWQTLGTGVFVLAVGLAGGWIISRSITRPIAVISQAASAISASNLSRRIETSGIDQELVGLATVLNETFARLEGAFVRQSRFTSDASHELRTPLAVIHSNAELALSRPRSVEEYRETLEACLRASSRMAALVDGLLTLARADAGRLETEFKAVDLRAIVEEVVDHFGPQAAVAKVAISTTLEEPVIVRGDLPLLSRIVGNLLSNAIRYTPAGGSVHLGLSSDGPDALLVVEDSGCGIPLEDQPRVFERFFRADKARSRTVGGNGLGLAICQSLVEVHHGRIGFTSIVNRGTRFEVRLPLANVAEAAAWPSALPGEGLQARLDARFEQPSVAPKLQ